jgi:hypothetical protein
MKIKKISEDVISDEEIMKHIKEQGCREIRQQRVSNYLVNRIKQHVSICKMRPVKIMMTVEDYIAFLRLFPDITCPQFSGIPVEVSTDIDDLITR